LFISVNVFSGLVGVVFAISSASVDRPDAVFVTTGLDLNVGFDFREEENGRGGIYFFRKRGYQ
jgi:hypothetical protein